MRLALIGGTGFVGAALLNEALQRGHQVTALQRDPSRLPARPGVDVRQADVLHAAQVSDAVAGHDAVLSAYNAGWQNPDLYEEFLRGSRAIAEGTRAAGVQRLLVVGGAGSLYVAPGVQLVDTPDFPAEWKQGALAAREALNLLRQETELAWTFVSPPVFLDPGAKRGGFRLGGDEVLMDAGQPARVTVGDLAVAVLDEVERPAHVRRRFTLGY
ncbi:NAD(P)-dependent oxidoreductase [Caldimonas brevitalea]|uniref:3-beta hydroxysteroid dehydrogenase n=1 Tax=Caldimonas brevitalea TaxID=413882 RepID=A0A0G3BVS2_9BURK|nr:NAD(P)-dependent oxidoreductase [Caldimonas brevitalea]AKJ32128.1 3-beta hydroxysteroid dehydrogenase [Caldimonas brevitalea]